MTKSQVHGQAFGYELNSIKPVHLANGFFLALTGKYYQLEWLNKLAVVSHKKGLRGDYETPRLHEVLQNEKGVLGPSFDLAALSDLRRQANAIVANDDAVYAAFDDYSAFGNDYTISGPGLLCDIKRKDGFAGYLLWRVFSETNAGRELIQLAKEQFEKEQDSIRSFLAPVLDAEDSSIEWLDTYEEKLGALTHERLVDIAATMSGPTSAILKALQNAQRFESRYAFLRQFIIVLGIWLTIYQIQEAASAASLPPPPLFCDFTGNASRKCRNRSVSSFSRHRELVFRAFEFWHATGRIESLDPFKKAGTGEYDFKDVERHFSDLTVRIGLAQPRAASVRAKHYELQPDTARAIIGSLVSADELLTFPELATRLRETWRIVLGGCEDDTVYLAEHGIIGLDEDDDLRLNRQSFIDRLKTLGLAFEPSDGVVLCSINLEDFR